VAVALAECCFIDPENPLGALVSYEVEGLRPDALLFGEDQGRILISTREQDAQPAATLARAVGVPIREIGRVTTEPTLKINKTISAAVGELAADYFGSIAQLVEGTGRVGG